MGKFNLKTRRKLQANQLQLRAEVSSVNEESRTIDICWTTGYKGMRRSYSFFGSGERYYEELAVDRSSVNMERIESGGAPVLDGHNRWSNRSVLGVVDRAWIEDGKGYATLRFDDDEDADKIWRKVAKGILRNFSVGYSVEKYEDVSEKGDEVRTLRAAKWTPQEISVVPIGFDPGAQSRSQEGDEVYDVEIVETRTSDDDEVGTNNDRGSGDVGRRISGNQSDDQSQNRQSENPPPASADTGLDESKIRQKAIEDERKRSAEIMTAIRAAKLSDKFGEDLVARGVDINEARAAIIDEFAKADNEKNDTRSHGGRIESGDRDEHLTRTQGIEAVLLNRGLPQHFELAEIGRDFANRTMFEMARECVEAIGVNTRSLSKNEIVSRAFHTTSDFTSALANTASKSLRRAYENAPQTFRPMVVEGTLPNYQAMKRVNMGGAPGLDTVMEGAEYTRGTIADGGEDISLVKYGKVFAITREAVINDDLQAFTRVPQLFGRAAADKESDLVWSVLTANANMADGVALFHADHGNLGSAGNITESNIGELAKLMRLQEGPEGRKLNLFPRFLIVPAALETVARQYLATELFASAASSVNPWKGMFELIVEPRLDATSAFNWFMAADPNQIDTIEISYLQGQRGVYTERRDGFDIDGMEIKARLEVGVKALDHRGLAKNPDAS